MFVQRLVTGPYQTNCYLLGDEETQSAWIVDPGNDSDLIISEIERFKVTPVALLFTHTHWDHITAAGALAARYPGLEVLVSEEDAPLLGLGGYEKIRQLCFDRRFLALYDEELKRLPEPTGFLVDNQVLDDSKLTVIKTPGHTKGGLCFYHEAGQFVLTGDTLFAGSIGRTDLGGGSMTDLLASCRRLLALDGQTQVLPGHGPTSTIEEQRSNPYLI